MILLEAIVVHIFAVYQPIESGPHFVNFASIYDWPYRNRIDHIMEQWYSWSLMSHRIGHIQIAIKSAC